MDGEEIFGCVIMIVAVLWQLALFALVIGGIIWIFQQIF
jgi:hypothetical protein